MLLVKNELEKKLLIDYLEKDPIKNVLFLADIYSFGLDNDFLKVYYSEGMKVVFLKYYNNYVLYSEKQDYCKEELFDMLISNNVNAISMSYEDYLYLKNDLDNYRAEVCDLLVLNKKLEHDYSGKTNDKVFIGTVDDASDYVKSFLVIDEFKQFHKKGVAFEELVNKKKKSIENGFNIHFCIKEDNQIVANANTSAIYSKAAVIGGVFTLEKYRNKGYAKSCVIELCKYLQDRNITPCLFYDNPIAGRMYKQIGFTYYCKWVIMIKK